MCACTHINLSWNIKENQRTLCQIFFGYIRVIIFNHKKSQNFEEQTTNPLGSQYTKTKIKIKGSHVQLQLNFGKNSEFCFSSLAEGLIFFQEQEIMW